jgi:anaerobic glycerol-3-phosphate dehydrogenase
VIHTIQGKNGEFRDALFGLWEVVDGFDSRVDGCGHGYSAEA